MQPSVRPVFWALSILMMTSTFCIYRVNSQESLTSQAIEPLPPETLEQRERREKFQAAWKKAKEQNYRAKLNNGSKRGGLKLEELPKEVRAEAEAAAQQYREKIYLSLKKYIATHNGQLPDAAFTLPEFEPFMRDTQYKGVGPMAYGRGSWTIGSSPRIDGTVMTRDVYSNDPPDSPHDAWADLNKFANYPTLGKGFLITGWDDGRVTFDLMEDNYYGIGTILGQQRPGAAVPGQAGIPPEFKQGLKKWFKKLDKDIQEAKPKEKKPEAKDGTSLLPDKKVD